MANQGFNFQKEHPGIALCGLDCYACPRYHTIGSSRCPGCAGKYFSEKHPSCGFISCAFKHGRLESCGLCPEIDTCNRITRLKTVIKDQPGYPSYQNRIANLIKIKGTGFEAFADTCIHKEALLKTLIDKYNDGRKKAFYCRAVQLLPLPDLENLLDENAKKGYKSVDDAALAVSNSLKELANKLGIEVC
ncbi:DUF3795 domain-containing protein [Dehalococcoides mccartyi]|jgi:hypothetical protein|nr:DUF3795 domain-containing protein [Dehalococcoides mccartyi]AII61322.1 hypothetical protein X794_05815 [Dehalococcoides mccartyi CG5]AMU87020.1 hypothetical protein Dm11a5_1194 [Dehalococcoides mccartyi]AOV99807.1 hypothetical protein DCWBC2_1184 [Dehalococcoides mccartyi]MBA2085588.1 hypothetical protein [Dehalococcoides mccartyi]QBX64335.1 DUF3795 domain-containing protein [Dehalococcoides mccartyi]